MRAAFALALGFVLLFSGCSAGSGEGIPLSAGKAPQTDSAGAGPHKADSILDTKKKPVASSGWLELFLDEASQTVSIRSHSEAEWSTLPRTSSTPKANQAACAVEAVIYANGQPLTLNSQDHAVAYGLSEVKNIDGKTGQGIQITYTLTPNEATAKKAASGTLAKSDVAFAVHMRYTLLEGNFRVQADWENVSGNPNAFIAELGFLERFGALRSPGPNDFFLLPDGCGALFYPAKEGDHTDPLRFTVYGDDPAAPAASGDTQALRANVAAFGVRGQDAGFIAVAEEGEALCDIAVQQSIAGEIAQSAVGFRFRITPVSLAENGTAAYRAPQSYGENKGETLCVTYRFFNSNNANFNTMAVACRELLISTGVLSSTKTVRSGNGLLPLNLTLLGTSPAKKFGQTALTTFEQAQDILMRMKNNGVDSINVRYQGALRGGWLQSKTERLSALPRLGGAKRLGELQEYCKSKELSLFLDVQLYPSGITSAAKTITGQTLRTAPPKTLWDAGDKTVTLRSMDTLIRASRSVISRVGKYETAGIALGDAAQTLYADYAGSGSSRTQSIQQLDQILPALSANWTVMLDTGSFYAVRHADVVVNLPMDTQVKMSGGRYTAVPLLPILLHSSVDYSGTPLNLEKDPNAALLRSIAYGACPAYVWQADDSSEQLYFELQLEDAMKTYSRANSALADLRTARLMEYKMDTKANVSTTTYSDGTILYVNYGSKEATVGVITIPPMDFVRIDG